MENKLNPVKISLISKSTPAVDDEDKNSIIYLSPDDIYYIDTLNSCTIFDDDGNPVTDDKDDESQLAVVTAGGKHTSSKSLFNSMWRPFFELSYLLLPLVLKKRFKVEYDEEDFKHTFANNRLQAIVDNVMELLSSIQVHALSGSKKKESLLSREVESCLRLMTLAKDGNFPAQFYNAIVKFYTKIYKAIISERSIPGKLSVSLFCSVLASEKALDTADLIKVENLVSSWPAESADYKGSLSRKQIAQWLQPKTIKERLTAVNMENQENPYKLLTSTELLSLRKTALKDFNEANDEYKKIEEKNFPNASKNGPSFEELKDLFQNHKAQYKKWSDALDKRNKTLKELIKIQWTLRKLPLKATTAEVIATCKKAKLPFPSLPEFDGMLSIASNPSAIFNYSTRYGRMLTGGGIGRKVIMNENYTKEDETYYCKYHAYLGKKSADKTKAKYTLYYTGKHQGIRFARVLEFSNGIEGTRRQLADILSKNGALLEEGSGVTLQPEDATSEAICALIERLSDLTGGRVGNRDSAKKGSYGLHTLQVRHVSFTEDGDLFIKYPGKNGKIYTHTVKDPIIIKWVKFLVENITNGSVKNKVEENNTENNTENSTKNKVEEKFIFSIKKEKSKFGWGDVPVANNTIREFLKKMQFVGSIHMFRHYRAGCIFANTTREYLEKKEKEFLSNNPGGTYKPSEKEVLDAYEVAIKEVVDDLQSEKDICIANYLDANLAMDYFVKNGVDKNKIPQDIVKAFKLRTLPGLVALSEEYDNGEIDEEKFRSDYEFLLEKAIGGTKKLEDEGEFKWGGNNKDIDEDEMEVLDESEESQE